MKKNIVLGASMMALSLGTSAQPKSKDNSLQPKVIVSKGVSANVKKITEDLLSVYNTRFGYPWNTLKVKDTLIKSLTHNGYMSEAISYKARMTLNKAFKYNDTVMRNIICHEITHTTHGKPRIFRKPVLLPDSTYAYGYDGAGIMLKSAAGEKDVFALIEESIAEYIASCTVDDYVAPNAMYYSGGYLCQRLVELEYVTQKELVQIVKASDVDLLLQKLYGSSDHICIAEVINFFQYCFIINQYSTTKEVIERNVNNAIKNYLQQDTK